MVDPCSEEESVAAMFRLGSLLMTLLLAAPMVHDCCSRVAQASCHESQLTGQVICSPNQQAIAETKTAASLNSDNLHTLFCTAVDANSTHFVQTQHVSIATSFVPISIRALYLQTGVLLI
jgi:hypothetical protein